MKEMPIQNDEEYAHHINQSEDSFLSVMKKIAHFIRSNNKKLFSFLRLIQIILNYRLLMCAKL